MTTSPHIDPLKMILPVVKIEKRMFPRRWMLFIDHTWHGSYLTKKAANLSLETKRAIVTSLYLTIMQFWKQRKSPLSRGYIKQSIKAIREITK